MKPTEGRYARDEVRIDFKTEKVRDVFPYEDKPWVKSPIKKHTVTAESHFLYKLAKEAGPGLIADVGTLNGGSACTLGHGLEEAGGGVIHAFDYFGSGTREEAGDPLAPGIIQQYFDSAFLNTKVQCHLGNCHVTAPLVEGEFAMAWIDADHSYECCKKDWNIWSKKVKVGGVIAFHDYQFFGVHQVIGEIDKSKWQYIRQVFSTVAFRRLA